MRRLFLLLSLPLLLNGCVSAVISAGTEVGMSAAENRSPGTKVDDTILYTAITNEFLQANQSHLLSDVTFNIRYARVMLTGTIGTEEDAQKAVALTWKAKGVQEVINELIVTKDSNFFTTANDSLIKRNLEARLLITKGVWVINYSMDVENGTAYLIGRVKDQAELNRVLNVAKTTKGIKRVVSHLQIDSDVDHSVPNSAVNANTAVEPVSESQAPAPDASIKVIKPAEPGAPIIVDQSSARPYTVPADDAIAASPH